MKTRYRKSVIFETKSNEKIEKREQLINEEIQKLQNLGLKVVAVESKSYSVATMALPVAIITSIVFEMESTQYDKYMIGKLEPVTKKEKETANAPTRFIKQVAVRLADKDMAESDNTINEVINKMAAAGVRTIHFDNNVFGVTQVLSPKWMITDILYEAEKPVDF